MQVVSGPVGKQKVHYEAPPAARVPAEMKKFLNWFEKPGNADPLFVAGLAHLWFVTIHPFDDGNGRIARAIADMALARSERTAHRRIRGQAHHVQVGEARQVFAGYGVPRHSRSGRAWRAEKGSWRGS